MSKTLANVTFVADPRGVKFCRNFRKLKVRIITLQEYANVALARSTFQVEFVYLKRKKIIPDFLLSEGMPGVLSWLYHGILQWTYLDELEKHVVDTDYISTVETYSFLSRQCAGVAKNSKKPLIVGVWQTIPKYLFNRVPPYSHNAKTVIENTDLFIAHTKRAKTYLKSLSVTDNKITVTYMGVNTSEFNPSNKKAQNPTPRILFVGNLIPHKGIRELLKAFALLYKSGVKADLWICGRGKLEPVVREYARRYPIKYLSFVKHDKIPDIYRQCDIFCLPSRDLRIFGIKLWEEQFGMALVEAMASGLPIISTTCGAIREVIGSKNIIVPQGSVKGLYLALRDLIENEKKRRQIGVSNRKRALELFDARKNCERLEKEILSLDSK